MKTANCSAAQDRSLTEAESIQHAVPVIQDLIGIVEELDGKLTLAKERIEELEGQQT
jgi:hypothetical protein